MAQKWGHATLLAVLFGCYRVLRDRQYVSDPEKL